MIEIRETAREIGVRMIDDRSKHEWIFDWLIFADDIVLLGNDEKTLQRLVNKFGMSSFCDVFTYSLLQLL